MAPPAHSTTLAYALTSFSPADDFLALSAGDGRIKIWDTARGHLQTEFADPSLNPRDSELGIAASRGHLALDYRCMSWVQLESKKKKKHGGSLLVLGTGSGDVLALDVAAGQWRWRTSDCHPGGVTSIAYSKKHESVYTAGVDGMVCRLAISTGNVVTRFKSSSEPVSSMSVSPDGKILAVAAGQLKTFTCEDNKKIQKYSGHPVAVRCMKFTEDGLYIISSGVGERYIAVWDVGTSKSKCASCILSLEHSPIYLDCRRTAADGKFYVLAISEIGICYYWCADNLNDLNKQKATKIMTSGSSLTNNSSGPSVFAAKLQEISKPASGHILVAYGSIVKPSFEKIAVHFGTDVVLNATRDGILLPRSLTSVDDTPLAVRKQVTALDRLNAEDAVLPLPKIYGAEKKRKHAGVDTGNILSSGVTGVNKNSLNRNVSADKLYNDDSICLEDRMRELGVLDSKIDEFPVNDLEKVANLSFDGTPSMNKIRSHIASMSSGKACELLDGLISAWSMRTVNPKQILPWIYCLLICHGCHIATQKSYAEVLGNLQKMALQRCAVSEDLAKLCGRFQLITAQINNASKEVTDMAIDEQDNDDNNDEVDGVDEIVYGVDESSGDTTDDDEL